MLTQIINYNNNDYRKKTFIRNEYTEKKNIFYQ